MAATMNLMILPLFLILMDSSNRNSLDRFRKHRKVMRLQSPGTCTIFSVARTSFNRSIVVSIVIGITLSRFSFLFLSGAIKLSILQVASYYCVGHVDEAVSLGFAVFNTREAHPGYISIPFCLPSILFNFL